ncbi:OmpA family protein [Marivirga harenae]|uniref:OmpA family protein n=1 Tax=Marivirga harenae TaxID=2010992 RepID=UPI0026DED55B|nr:OmpA family protein [Marivirga harenae]WKV11250.1 OmpA family protein [Marivirga harenae]|tara:strand:- start:5349 stop:6944 length:1596 start_codon:yes stop_codon:yes gene_type:complete
MQKILIGLLILCFTTVAMAQKRKLPATLSNWDGNEYAPKLTADGRTIIYMSDYTDSGDPEIFMSSATGTSWERGMPIQIPNKDMIPFGSYNLSYEGDQLIYSSRKGPNIGGYDILFQQKKGSNWAPAINHGKPLNSPLHEMDPTLSADGKTLYFSRCETLDPVDGNCKLFSAEYLGDVYWKEPQEIQIDLASSSFVNPVILPDNKTIYFAALNSNGNYDFYMSRKENDSWSKAVPMDFLNTSAHDRYIGVTALGDVAYIHEKGERGYDLYMVKVPEEFQPAKVYYLEGTVTNLPAKALVKATDLESGEELARLILGSDEKTFGIYLPENHQVDFYIETKEQGFGYYSEFLNLDSMQSSKKVVKDITLPTLQRGELFPISIRFKDYTSDFAIGAEEELARLITLMKQNRGFEFKMEIYQQSITESEQYADSLPEIRYDTVLVDYNQIDTLATETSIQSEVDSTALEEKPTTEIVSIYHNDLTQKRADAIKAYLLDKGVPEDMFSVSGMGESRELDYSDIEEAKNSKVVFRLE